VYEQSVIASWERKLSHLTGADVFIDEVSRPRRGVTLFNNVQFNTADTAAIVVSARVVEVSGHNGQVSIILSQPEIRAGQMRSLFTFIQKSLLRRRQVEYVPVDVKANELTIRRDTNSLTLKDIRCTTTASGTDTELSCSFRMAGSDMPEAATLRLVKSQESPPVTSLRFDTGITSLPCSALFDSFPSLVHIGETCQFRGSLSAAQTTHGWKGTLAGQLNDVDFDQLITEQFPHRLSGMADVALERVTFDNGRITEIKGNVESKAGVISRSLLAAAATELGCQRITDTESRSERYVQFSQFALDFQLDAKGLSLLGNCTGPRTGTILKMDSRSILLDSQTPRISAIALIRVLVPQNEHQVPATKETSLLVRVLPLPSLIPPHDDGERSSFVPLRIDEEKTPAN
jgi:hypothetical protein